MGRDARDPKRWREREPKERILVAMDARKTEYRYLTEFRKQVPGCVPFTPMGRGTLSPSGLARFGIQQVENHDFTEVWLVFDEDQYREEGDLSKALRAIKTARAKGLAVHPAISSPCFEFFLLLHHRMHAADEELHRDEAMRRLKIHVNHYDKTDLDFADFKDGVDEAVKRAKDLCEAHPPKSYKNPSTGMGYLIDRLTGKHHRSSSR